MFTSATEAACVVTAFSSDVLASERSFLTACDRVRCSRDHGRRRGPRIDHMRTRSPIPLFQVDRILFQGASEHVMHKPPVGRSASMLRHVLIVAHRTGWSLRLRDSSSVTQVYSRPLSSTYLLRFIASFPTSIMCHSASGLAVVS